MVWFNRAEAKGRGLYLDIHHAETRRNGRETVFALSGTLGDGGFEGEVLVELGSRVEVTFADAWLDPGSLELFFARVPREAVEEGVAEALHSIRFCLADFPALTGVVRNAVVGYRCDDSWVPLSPAAGCHEFPPGVAEADSSWSRRAV
ncbi:MAG TPA: hypothetical protein VGA43_04790 [Deferrimonas sp.]|jgi:hypothetical protein